MKLLEALKILKSATPEGAEPFNVSLACGFNPLHLETFLGAQLRLRAPDLCVKTRTGLYGDLPASLRSLADRDEPLHAGAVVIEWQDLDPRLGIRQLSNWSPAVLSNILKTVGERLDWLNELIAEAAEDTPLAICLPTLPVPPVSYEPAWQAGGFSLELHHLACAFGASLGRATGARILSGQFLDQCAPPSERLDAKSELMSGFPYKLPFASKLAELLAQAILPTPPRKGLITDLDNTLWRGLVGEVGADGISWSLDEHSQMHALYQLTLSSLAEAGVLIAVASKNEPATVASAFKRADLLLPEKKIFPLEVGWGTKSEAVGRILSEWNVDQRSVVFVDDSPMELAEVKAAHPGIECLQFPARDEQAAYNLLFQLRALFGKSTVTREDALRLESVRQSAAFTEEASRRVKAGGNGHHNSDHLNRFLEQVEAELTLDFRQDLFDQRALELVNKTNQFNLNGRRYAEGAWRQQLRDPKGFSLVATYSDKFGPLGKIAVLAGSLDDDALLVKTWVMSCRAFSRRIEHQCLQALFDRFQVREVILDFAPTAKNGPLRAFIGSILDGGRERDNGSEALPSEVRLDRETVFKYLPPLYHKVSQTD